MIKIVRLDLYGSPCKIILHIFFHILGCTVRAFDPTDEVIRPQNSYHPNIHFYKIGITKNPQPNQFPGQALKIRSFKIRDK